MARLGGSAAAGCSEAAERKCNVVTIMVMIREKRRMMALTTGG